MVKTWVICANDLYEMQVHMSYVVCLLSAIARSATFVLASSHCMLVKGAAALIAPALSN